MARGRPLRRQDRTCSSQAGQRLAGAGMLPDRCLGFSMAVVVVGGETLGSGGSSGATIRICPSYWNTCRGTGAARDLVGKLLILRLTTRGRCFPRLRSAGTAMISIRISSTMRRRRRGGKRGMEGQMPPDDAHRVDERQRV